MRLPDIRLRIRSVMILVMVSAVVLTVWSLVPRALDPLLIDRAGTLPAVWVGRGAIQRFAAIALLTGMVASPFVLAIVLAFKSSPGGRSWRRRAARWLGVALYLACGLAIFDYPLDGLRSTSRLRDGSGVSFYHQYRFWPGRHITPCLELISPQGSSRTYAIARNTRYRAEPHIRTDAGQDLIWFIDIPGARIRYGGVWCSLNRETDDFVGAGGPFPPGVSEATGFPPTR